MAELGRQGHDRGELDRPTDLAVDDLGLLCVVDIGNNRIQVFSRSGPSRYRRRDACDDGTCAAPAPQAARVVLWCAGALWLGAALLNVATELGEKKTRGQL